MRRLDAVQRFNQSKGIADTIVQWIYQDTCCTSDAPDSNGCMEKRRIVMSEVSLSSNRRSFLASSAALGASALLTTKAQAASEDKGIRPFHVNFPEEQLVDLRRRVKARAVLGE
jgi:hypothetical protein